MKRSDATATLSELEAAYKIWQDLPGAVVGEVMVERARQDAQWGGPEHDDDHKLADWLTYIDQQVRKAHQLLRDAPDDTLDTDQHDEALRGRLVKVAALAFAGLASYERKNRPAVCQCAGCQLETALLGIGVDVGVHGLSATPTLDAMVDVLRAIVGRASGKGGGVH